VGQRMIPRSVDESRNLQQAAMFIRQLLRDQRERCTELFHKTEELITQSKALVAHTETLWNDNKGKPRH
jgi:hypothetical protein